MSPERRKALIQAHCGLRKVAFEAVAPQVDRYFREAEAALHTAKTAAETSAFDATLRRHFSET